MLEKNEFIFGTVSDNADPDGMGRVKVTYQIEGEEKDTNWFPCLSLYATNESGAFFLPEIGDQVVLAFMTGSHEKGFIMGSLWHQENTPPVTEENTASDLNDDGENNLQFIKSRSGNMLIFDDKSGEEKVQLIASGGATRVEFLLADEEVNMETDVDLRITAKGKIMIEAEEGELSFSKGLNIEGKGIIMDSSDTLDVTASGNMGIEGSSVKLN